MKKVLACLLVLTMVLGSFSVAFAGTYADVADDASYADAVEVLSALKVVQGDEAGFRPNDVIKRSEVAKIMVEILGYGDFAKVQKATNFSDVPASHWASGYISFAADLGIVKGDGNGTFRPDAVVSYDEVLTMAVRALGYDEAGLVGSWPTNYIVKAKALNLVTNAQIGSTGATRGAVAEVVFKALTEQTVTYVELLKQHQATGTNLLVDALKATPSAAFVVPFGSTGLLADHVGEYGVSYTVANKVVAFVAQTVELTGKLETKNSKNVFAGYEFDNNSVDFDGSAVLLLNNGTTGASNDLTSTVTIQAVLKNGKIDTITGVEKWTATSTVKVQKADVDKIAAKDPAADISIFGSALKVDTTKKVINTANVAVVGADSLAAIAKDSIVTVYVGDSYITKIEVSTAKVAGQITKVAGSKYTINGVEYSANGSVDSSLVLGTKGTWSLDAAGKLFAYTADNTTIAAVNYALITEAAQDKVNGTSGVYGATEYKNAKVQLMAADGTVAVYNVNKDAYTSVWSVIGSAAVDTLIKYTLNDAGEIVSAALVSVSNGAALTTYGTLDGKLVASNVLVLQKTGVLGTNASTDKYALGAVANLKSTLTVKYAVDTASNVVVIVADTDDLKVTTSTNYAFFTGTAADVMVGTKKAQEITAVINGVAGTYQTVAGDVAGTLLSSVDSKLLYSVTLTDGKITALTQVDLTEVVASWTKVAAVSGNLVDLVEDPAVVSYSNVAGATVYTATYKADKSFAAWSVGSMADVVKDAKVVMYKDAKAATGVAANIIFVLPVNGAEPAAVPAL